MAEMPSFQYWVLRVQSLVGELRSHMLCGKAKNKIKVKKETATGLN